MVQSLSTHPQHCCSALEPEALAACAQTSRARPSKSFVDGQSLHTVKCRIMFAMNYTVLYSVCAKDAGSVKLPTELQCSRIAARNTCICACWTQKKMLRAPKTVVAATRWFLCWCRPCLWPSSNLAVQAKSNQAHHAIFGFPAANHDVRAFPILVDDL